jgi:hypothetical protein
MVCDNIRKYSTLPKEKVLTITGPEFGSEAGKTMLAIWVLYGLKSPGSAF